LSGKDRIEAWVAAAAGAAGTAGPRVAATVGAVDPGAALGEGALVQAAGPKSATPLRSDMPNVEEQTTRFIKK
jgi:hypothetical protein